MVDARGLVRERGTLQVVEPPTQTASSWRVRANDDTSSAKFGKFVAWTHRTVEPARLSSRDARFGIPSMNLVS